jgi:hypothetical protein
MFSLGKKFGEPKLKLGGKVMGVSNSLGKKNTTNANKNNLMHPEEEKVKHNPLERRH